MEGLLARWGCGRAVWGSGDAKAPARATQRPTHISAMMLRARTLAARGIWVNQRLNGRTALVESLAVGSTIAAWKKRGRKRMFMGSATLASTSVGMPAQKGDVKRETATMPKPRANHSPAS